MWLSTPSSSSLGAGDEALGTFRGSWVVMWTDDLDVILQSEHRSLVVKNFFHSALLGDVRGMLVTVHRAWFGHCR